MIDTRNDAESTPRPRALLLSIAVFALGACDSGDRLTSQSSNDALAPTGGLAAGSASGIPFGAFSLPDGMYGAVYTGGHVNPQSPEYLLPRLAVIREAGARVVLALAGAPSKFTNADGTYNFDLWKARVDRFTTVDFASYVSDGTVLGHYVVDQPNCSACWGGQAIPQSTVEAMAQHSKSNWPAMMTVVRADPTWLAAYSGQYVYLDAGWAQYVHRKGDVDSYLAANQAAAEAEGLGLVVGLNLLNGGPNGSAMSAKQVRAWGSTLLGSEYACAFISRKYDQGYFSRSDIRSALEFLSSKARRHAPSPCQR